jgi:hypothetical protein
VHGGYVPAGLKHEGNFGRVFALQNPVLQHGVLGHGGQSGGRSDNLPVYGRNDVGGYGGQRARFYFARHGLAGKHSADGNQGDAGNDEQKHNHAGQTKIDARSFQHGSLFVLLISDFLSKLRRINSRLPAGGEAQG